MLNYVVLWDSKGVDVVAAVNYMVSDFSIYQTHFYKFLSPRNCAKLKKPDLVSFINQNLLTNVFIT